MLFKVVVLFLAIGAVYVASVPTPIEIEAESSLVNILLSSPAMRSDIFNVECVDYYSPLLKGHVDKYNEDFNTCNYNYENAYSLIDASFAYARNELSNFVKETCVSLLACDGKSLNYDAFECLALGVSDKKNNSHLTIGVFAHFMRFQIPYMGVKKYATYNVISKKDEARFFLLEHLKVCPKLHRFL